MKLEDRKIAILHDRFPQVGGGEKFAIEAARVLDAPIYTMYVSEGVEDSIPNDVTVRSLKQDKYTGNFVKRRFLQWSGEGMNPLETLNVALDMAGATLDEYDIVLESAPLSKSYVPNVDQTVIHYPHSPPRWLYDLYRVRVDSFDTPGIALLVKGYAKIWRALDKEANDYVDKFIANSELVQKRIKRYYGRESAVVYPPVSGEWRNEGDDGYFVTWSRLTPEKRILMIADAFTDLDEQLVIAGDGEQREKIEKIAGENENIDFRGYVDDIESLVANSKAVVYAPRNEDFGLVGAETLLSGKPLLGVDEGFTKHQVIEHKTGISFEPNTDSIKKTVREFNSDEFVAEEIQSVAKKYEYRNFERNLIDEVRMVAEENPT